MLALLTRVVAHEEAQVAAQEVLHPVARQSRQLIAGEHDRAAYLCEVREAEALLGEESRGGLYDGLRIGAGGDLRRHTSRAQRGRLSGRR